MARNPVFPKELVLRLVLDKAPKEGIDLKKYNIPCMGHVVDELPKVDNWRIPAFTSIDPSTCENYLTVIVSQSDDGIVKLDFSEI